MREQDACKVSYAARGVVVSSRNFGCLGFQAHNRAVRADFSLEVLHRIAGNAVFEIAIFEISAFCCTSHLATFGTILPVRVVYSLFSEMLTDTP